MKTNVELQRDVIAELGWDPAVDASQVGVTTHDGVVTLAGHVTTHTERHAAEKVTKRVHGVKAVANELEVRPSEAHQRDDEHLAAAAVHALEWDVHVPPERIRVVVSDGWITLEGTADQRHQRDAAERAVRHLIGVRGLTNNVELAPQGEPEKRRPADEIKEGIELALRRSALVDSRRITVEMVGHQVILTGDVRSRAEYDEVERIARTAWEVSAVENCVTVTPWGFGPMEEWGY